MQLVDPARSCYGFIKKETVQLKLEGLSMIILGEGVRRRLQVSSEDGSKGLDTQLR